MQLSDFGNVQVEGAARAISDSDGGSRRAGEKIQFSASFDAAAKGESVGVDRDVAGLGGTSHRTGGRYAKGSV